MRSTLSAASTASNSSTISTPTSRTTGCQICASYPGESTATNITLRSNDSGRKCPACGNNCGKPALLDLFSGAGGAARGYQLAGFCVLGIDVKPQPHYAGCRFHQVDALEYVAEHGQEFDAIHASPPCQAYTNVSNRWRGRGGKADQHPDLIAPTRAALEATGLPWVLENVHGAPVSGVTLHGGMFGLGVHRPRLFESNVLLMLSWAAPAVDAIGVYGEHPDGRWLWQRTDGTRQRAAHSIEEARTAMGIDWMDWEEIREAIPPAFTLWIGRQLIAALASTPSKDIP